MNEKLTGLLADQVPKHGPWTAANFEVAPGLFTMKKGIVRDEIKLRRVVQIITDLARKPLGELRILDLACLEGLYAIELALQGATVVANDIRERHVAMTAFAKRILDADRLEIRHDDVRNVSKETYGVFDIVLCQGILYHLDTPDSFRLLKYIYEVCTGFAVIDTRYAGHGPEIRVHCGRQYRGLVATEHPPGTSPERKVEQPWASIDNNNSFLFTRESLYNLLADVGFSSILECHWPSFLAQEDFRSVFVAMKGASTPIRSSSVINHTPHERYPQ